MIKIKNCTADEFKIVLQEKKIICVGAGDELKRICKKYSFIINSIRVVVDNNKKNTLFELEGKNFIVDSVEGVSVNSNDILVVSTIKYADDIIKQIDNIAKFAGMDVYVPYFFEKNVHEKFEIKSNIYQIPKIIHYCWFGGGEIPDCFKNNIQSWKKYCPDYEIVCWDETNYDYKKNEYMYEAYKKKKWGFVPDYATLDIVNEYGGIYLDTDVEIIKPWDDLLQYKLFCGFESDEYVAFGLGFGGIADNDILQRMMDLYDKTSFLMPDGSLNLTASPIYQTEILKENGLKTNGELQNLNDCIVFPSEYFAPIDAYGIGKITDNTYSIHQYAATWFDEKTRFHKERIIESISYVKGRMNN